MNKNILKTILQMKGSFIPLIFTEKQFNVLRKHSAKARLSNAEKKALYTSIKKKMEALNLFSREQKDKEYYINSPNEIISIKLKEAKQLIDNYSKEYDNVFIAGSFLFSEDSNDIDIFIIKEKGYKEIWDKNKHLIFLSEKKLADPVFQSASLISISNFIIPRKIKKKKPSLSALMATYHEAVIEYMKKEKKPESIRRLVFDYNLFCKNKLLNGKELKITSEKLQLNDLNVLIKGLCKRFFSETYLYVAVHDYINTLKQSIKNIMPNKHLITFKNTYEEMIYGKQRNKVEAD